MTLVAQLQQVSLNWIDVSVFLGYMLLTVAIGFWAARGARSKPKDYFLGDRKLPWYVVGTSMVSTDISSETFIANVGIAYVYGMVVSTGSWNVWIIYTILIFIFLPYYVRTGLYTMPQFLERRYNSTCRYFFAASLVVGYIVAILAGSLYAGGLSLQKIFGMNIVVGIVMFALVTGAYTVWGGLKSAAWTDFMQMLVLMFAGIVLPVLALQKAGGIATLARDYPDHFDLFLPASHRQYPWTGVFTGFLTVGLWYSCTSQHIVQRVLSAKDEWHARMGVISAGYLRIITPLFFVIPGIAAYKLYPQLKARPDLAYLQLVIDLIPVGLTGVILAGMAAALMSTVSAVLNSTSTLLTIDLYKRLWRPDATPRQEVMFGQISGVFVLLASVLISFLFVESREELFRLVQRIFFFIAPPFAVVFPFGLLWRRANGTAAVVTIVVGFLFRALLELVLFPYIPALRPYQQAYQNGALINWAFCVVLMIVVSLLTKPPPPEQTAGIIWDRSFLQLPPEERARYSGWKDFRIWWAMFVVIILGIYAFFAWWQFGRG
ncbi:MAG TPA: sodium/solute symporter [Tepidisphaeraceae bacterium]|nr:sodium/solute symporter [Tepidisphaeraceae bacterium]